MVLNPKDCSAPLRFLMAIWNAEESAGCGVLMDFKAARPIRGKPLVYLRIERGFLLCW